MVMIVLCQARYAHSAMHHHHSAPVSQLHSLVLGEVLPCCGDNYQHRRLVNNRACRARPAVIVRPVTTEDVAVTVNYGEATSERGID